MQSNLFKIAIIASTALAFLIRAMFKFESYWVRVADWVIKPYNVSLNYIREEM